MSRFGFGQRVALDMYGEADGLMPSRQWKRALRRQAWFPGETLILGIGQGYMQSTPLQLAQMTALLANKGKWIRPHLAKTIDGKPPVDEDPMPDIQLKDPNNWNLVDYGMQQVVHGARGTAHKVGATSVYRIAGKSGTAQVVAIKQGEKYNRSKLLERHRDHALFVGFAPADNPQIAVAVMVENGESGSGVAAPVLKAVTDAWLLDETGKLKPEYAPQATAEAPQTMTKNGNFDRTLSSEDVMKRRSSLLQRLHIDGLLLLLLVTLGSVGLFVLYSASGKSWDLLIKQASSFGLGLGAMFVLAQIEPRFLARWVPLGYLIGVALLVVVDVMGHNAMGATRWINIPGVIRFQPAEFMKLLMPMTIAWYLSKRALPPGFKHSVIGLALIVVPFVLILKQPDLGTAMLVLASGSFVLFVGGLRWRWIITAVSAAVPVAVGMWYFVMHDYQKQRVLTFLDPESDPLGTGWNIIQSKAAIGSGGVFGKGWLLGTQSHLDFLPESHTDFIIAVLGEEFGLVGVCLLLVLYLLVIYRGLVITAQAQTLFGKLLAGSITMTFFVYVFVNIGMVSGLLPVVGVPLPFISYGGTSLVTLMSGFGVLMSIHTHRKWITQV